LSCLEQRSSFTVILGQAIPSALCHFSSAATLYNELANNSELSTKVKEIYNKRYNAIKDILREAQESGLIDNEINCESLSDIIIGLFRAVCLRWRLSGNSFPLKEVTLQSLNVLLDAFVKTDLWRVKA